jgi:hypothetical protein
VLGPIASGDFKTFSNGRYTNSGIGDFMTGMVSSQGLTLFREARAASGPAHPDHDSLVGSTPVVDTA